MFLWILGAKSGGSVLQKCRDVAFTAKDVEVGIAEEWWPVRVLNLNRMQKCTAPLYTPLTENIITKTIIICRERIMIYVPRMFALYRESTVRFFL